MVVSGLVPIDVIFRVLADLTFYLKVACKYITDPVLFHREEIGKVKMDIRYVVMLVSVKPLVVYAYDIFWLRFANKYVIHM